MQDIPVAQPQASETGLAKPCCVRQHRIECWRKLAGRRTDDAKHLRCSFLPLQCLIALAGETCEFCFFGGTGAMAAVDGLGRVARFGAATLRRRSLFGSLRPLKPRLIASPKAQVWIKTSSQRRDYSRDLSSAKRGSLIFWGASISRCRNRSWVTLDRFSVALRCPTTESGYRDRWHL